MAKNPIQQISIIQELELSIETIKTALSIIQRIEHQKTPSFLIFVLLSTGIERLFKLIIGMRLMSDGSEFPTESELKNNKKFGHNLTEMKKTLLSLCFNESRNITIIENDKEFLENDWLLNELLVQLSEFALGGRYVYMNKAANENSTGKWLSHRWDEIESKIVGKDEAVAMLLSNQESQYKQIISNRLVITIERLLGAVCRTITLCKMDGDSNSAGTLLYEFLFLKEAELGKRRYDLFGFSPI